MSTTFADEVKQAKQKWKEDSKQAQLLEVKRKEKKRQEILDAMVNTLTTLITETKKKQILTLISEGKSRIVIRSDRGGEEWGWKHPLEDAYTPEAGEAFRNAVGAQVSINCAPLKISIDYHSVDVNTYGVHEWLECIIQMDAQRHNVVQVILH